MKTKKADKSNKTKLNYIAADKSNCTRINLEYIVPNEKFEAFAEHLAAIKRLLEEPIKK